MFRCATCDAVAHSPQTPELVQPASHPAGHCTGQAVVASSTRQAVAPEQSTVMFEHAGGRRTSQLPPVQVMVRPRHAATFAPVQSMKQLAALQTMG